MHAAVVSATIAEFVATAFLFLLLALVFLHITLKSLFKYLAFV